jgi:(p)ppGpp synthase/HD superfamily hydrolase
MKETDLLDLAILTAVEFHMGQVDKGGLPYILHPLAVMGSVEGFDAKMVAVMHDVVEDTTCTLRTLETAFPAHVVAAVDAISKREGERKEAYWARVKADPLALRVKLADIAHNTSPKRMAVLRASEREYLQKKYRKALAFLRE